MIQVKAVSFETMALGTPLAFPAPLAQLAPDPDGFEFFWRLLTYAFGLPNPSSFPRLPNLPSQEDAAVLRRYLLAAEDLASSTILSSKSFVRVTMPTMDDDPQVQSEFSSAEVTRGFTVLFRQFHSNKEDASFIAARRVLRAANEAAADEYMEERKQHLTAWSKARASLLGENLRVRVGQRLQADGRMPPGELPGQSSDRVLGPEQLISAYQYGDLIHWGSKRRILETAGTDPFEEAWQRMLFLDAVGGLAHLYLGFALLLEAALPAD
jgi:hypothetical protein